MKVLTFVCSSHSIPHSGSVDFEVIQDLGLDALLEEVDTEVEAEAGDIPMIVDEGEWVTEPPTRLPYPVTLYDVNGLPVGLLLPDGTIMDTAPDQNGTIVTDPDGEGPDAEVVWNGAAVETADEEGNRGYSRGLLLGDYDSNDAHWADVRRGMRPTPGRHIQPNGKKYHMPTTQAA